MGAPAGSGPPRPRRRPMTPQRLVAPLALLFALLACGSAFAAPSGSTLLVSRPDGLGPVPPANDGDSSPGALSSDGRYAVFTSQADGISPDANPRVLNVFLRDRQTGTTTLVSRSNDGKGVNDAARNPDVTVAANGHVLVAFESTATNMSDAESGPVANPRGVSEVWLRDVDGGTTRLVSRATGASGAPADEDARRPALADSAGGPLVVFETQATNLGATGVLLRTVDAHETQQISCPRSDCAHPSSAGAIDADIRVVSGADGLCANNTFKLACIQVAFVTTDKSIFDAANPQVIMATALAPLFGGLHPAPFSCCNALSIAGAGPLGNAGSSTPSFSGDGLAVAFLTHATNLGGNP